jgi:hypothetical protein
MHLWNVGLYLQDNTAQRPRRQSYSYASLWEPEILPNRDTAYLSIRTEQVISVLTQQAFIWEVVLLRVVVEAPAVLIEVVSFSSSPR